jgi:hypothetical protein
MTGSEESPASRLSRIAARVRRSLLWFGGSGGSDALRRAFWIALGVKVALLLLLVQTQPDALVTDDTSSYVEPAWNLIDHLSFSSDGQAELLRTPGYPLFLVPFLVAFGDAWMPAVVVAHFLLVGATAYLVYRLVLIAVDHEARESIARLAFVLVLFEPNIFLSQYAVATEVLFTSLLVAGVYFGVRFLRQKEAGWALLGALFLSAAAYVRPIGLYLPYLLGAAGLVYCVAQKRWRLSGAVVGALALHLVLTGAWSVRNEARTGVRTFTTISHLNLWEYVGASVASRAHGEDWGDTRARFHEQLESWPGNEAERAEAAADSAMEILRAHPTEAATIWLQGLVTNVADPGTGDVANTMGWRESDSGIIYKYVSMSPPDFLLYLVKNEKALLACLAVGGIWLLVLWGGAIYGYTRLTFAPSAVGALLLLCVVYLLFVAAGPQSMARFRMPATPLILVYTSTGLYTLWRHRRNL